MSPTGSLKDDGWTRYWPFGVAGFTGPLLAAFVSRWASFPVSLGLGMFVGFSAAVWLFPRTSARRSVTASLVSGLAAGLVSGFVAFLLA